MAELSLDIHVQAKDWQSIGVDSETQILEAQILEAQILETLKAALDCVEGSTKSQYEVSLLLTDDAHQQVLNQQWRDKDKSTNVLSFPSGEAEAPFGMAIFLGDMSLAYETVRREAQEQHKDFSDHLRHLLVHGLLHLLGYDHETDKQAEEMESLEIKILKAMGLQSPYGDFAPTAAKEEHPPT